MDVLDDVLDTLRFRGVVYFRTEFSGPFAVTVPDLQGAARFHTVLEGRCHVRLRSGATLDLGPGDIVMITRGQEHVLADHPSRSPAPLETVLEEAGFQGSGVFALGAPDGASGAATRMVCGHYTFRPHATHPFLDALPAYILVTPAMRASEPWLDALMGMLSDRAREGELGAASAVKRLSEVVFAEVVRSGLANEPALSRLIGAFRDPQIGKALGSMHHAPDRPWTVEELASAVGMSRSVFASRFREAVGMPPMAYLAEWRFQKALALLEDTRLSIKQIAAATGYMSAAAFSRAFAARFDMPPQSVRRTD